VNGTADSDSNWPWPWGFFSYFGAVEAKKS
jgi:hypothetical protein